MKNTWVSSDIHFGHSNSHGGIIAMCKRPFSSLEEMEDTIIANQNALVRPEDDYYHVGDLAYRCSAQYTVERLRRLSGRIKIIFGNHDKPLRQAINSGMVDDLIKSGKLTIIGSTDPNIISAYRLTYNNVLFIISHYAYRSWPSAFRGAIHLFGHSHNNLPSYHKSFDIGVDANNFMPVNLNSIIEKASKINMEFSEK